MKRLLAPLIALAFLAGVCPATAKPTRQLSPESLGTRSTAWGVLPTYNVSGQRFTFARRPRPPGDSFALWTVTLDVLVNADGSVEDATVTTSSGDPGADFAALASFIGARYSLQPGDNYPAPFVVQQKLIFTQGSVQRPSYTTEHRMFAPQGSMPPSGSQYYQASPFTSGSYSTSSSSSK